MLQTPKFILSAATLITLSACVEVSDSGMGQMAPSPSGPPFITTIDASVSAAAIGACRDILDAQTDGAVTIVGAEFSQAASAVYMRVGANGAPWRCLVSNDGTGASLMFMGDEGAM